MPSLSPSTTRLSITILLFVATTLLLLLFLLLPTPTTMTLHTHDPATTRLRILCLHGYHGSARTMRGQASAAATVLAPYADLVYIDAPSLAVGDFGWWHAKDRGTGNPTYVGWDRTRAGLQDIWASQGPFDGVLGFSQGAVLASILVGMDEFPMRFAIMAGGFLARDRAFATASYANTHRYAIPSLHIYGRSDGIVAPQASAELSDRFANPTAVVHDGGHVIAATGFGKNIWTAFIKEQWDAKFSSPQSAQQHAHAYAQHPHSHSHAPSHASGYATPLSAQSTGQSDDHPPAHGSHSHPHSHASHGAHDHAAGYTAPKASWTSRIKAKLGGSSANSPAHTPAAAPAAHAAHAAHLPAQYATNDALAAHRISHPPGPHGPFQRPTGIRAMQLWPTDSGPRIRVTFPTADGPGTGWALVIFRGGAYSTPRGSGGDAAAWAAARGFVAAEVDYSTRTTNSYFPQNAQDGQRAVRVVRNAAASWGVRADRVAVVGFSAGGHLAAVVAVGKNIPRSAADDLAHVSARPDAAVLAYGVLSFVDGYRPGAYLSTVDNYFGGPRAHDQALRDSMSPDLTVDSSCPPVFVWTLRGDAIVPYTHSTRFADAAKHAGVPTQLYVYKQGGHGIGMAVGTGYDCESWGGAWMAWMGGLS